MTDIRQSAMSVKSREDLRDFVRLLASDLQDSPSEWANSDLASFLEALAGWIDDMDGYYSSVGAEVPTVPSWQTTAEMLAAARIYE